MKEQEDHILQLLPQDQFDRVMNQPDCDIEPVFMGFTDIYKSLSGIIPKHWTVVDLGCAYNPLCFYFKEHKKYVAVDGSDCEKFQTENCEVYVMGIGEFIKEHLAKFNLKETFAICSYVPMWGEVDKAIVGKSFPNLFIYYPHGCDNITLQKPISEQEDNRSVANPLPNEQNPD
jgi:hypothetical protein